MGTKVAVYLALCLAGLIAFKGARCQDIHFSQFYAAPLFLNPSLTGSFDGKFRFGANHRNQWASVTEPFVTYIASADAKITHRKHKKRSFGAGLMILRDQAGDSKYGTTAAMASFSATLTLGRDQHHWLSMGLKAGAAQRSLDYSKLYFDDQFNGNIFDPGNGSAESLGLQDFVYPDAGAGLTWSHINRSDLKINIGLAYDHFNKPRQSFFEYSDITLNPRWSVHSAVSVPLPRKRILEPSILLMRQGEYSEVLVGSSYNIIFNDNPFAYSAVNFGLYYRILDAAILKAGIEMRDFSAGISYDFNLSGLHPASNYQGGIELSVNYIIRSHYRLIERYPACPVF